MFSETPGTPGRSAQIPRTLISTSTPACEARYSARIEGASSSEFIFRRIRAGRRGRVRLDRPLDLRRAVPSGG